MIARACLRLAVILAVTPGFAAAHEGHAEAPGEAAAATGDVVSVSEEGRRNLGLELAEAKIRPLETTLAVVGEIAAVPALSGAVSSRIAGRVVAITVAEGDSVRRGQRVVQVESLQVGDPPPRAWYSSPLDGVVVDRHVVPGDSVEPNAHLLMVADLHEVLAIGRIFEGQVGRVAVGQAVRVRVPSYPDMIFPGVVERIGGQLDDVTRSLPLYVRVENPDARLRPNMRAVLAVVTGGSDAALVVPKSAVLGDFGALFVFVEEDADPSRFQRRPVVTGLFDDRYVEILEGVLPGERVVTRGNYSLQFLPPAPPEPHAGEDASGEPVAPAPSDAGTGASSWWPIAAGIGGLLCLALLSLGFRRLRVARDRA